MTLVCREPVQPQCLDIVLCLISLIGTLVQLRATQRFLIVCILRCDLQQAIQLCDQLRVVLVVLVVLIVCILRCDLQQAV